MCGALKVEHGMMLLIMLIDAGSNYVSPSDTGLMGEEEAQSGMSGMGRISLRQPPLSANPFWPFRLW